jgi:hypothetical protein
MGRQDEAAPRAKHIIGLWFVRADLGVWIFDGFDQLSAVLAEKFHGTYFTADPRTSSAILETRDGLMKSPMWGR